MREYAKICPSFWTGDTGRLLRQEPPTVTLVALYLMSNPHATATGLYRLPVAYACEDTGLDREVYGRALDRLEELDYLRRDGDTVWVRTMGAYQVGDSIPPKDNRRKWVGKVVIPYTRSPLYQDFWDRYGEAWGLPEAPCKGLARPFKGGKHPLRSMEIEREMEQDPKKNQNTTPPPTEIPTTTPSTIPSPREEGVPLTAPPDGGAPPTAGSKWWGEAEAKAQAKLPTDGQVVKALRDPGGGVSGVRIVGGSSLAPGPWRPPLEVREWMEDEVKVPRYFLPRPPRLEGADGCNTDDDDALVGSMVIAYSAARHRHEGKPYRGHGGRTRAAIAEAARMLRAEEIPPHAFFGWVWSQLSEHSPRQLGTLASPKMVARHHASCPSGALDRVYLPVPEVEELHAHRERLWTHITAARPDNLGDARRIAQGMMDPQAVAHLTEAANTTAARLKDRAEAKLARGYWIWP